MLKVILPIRLPRIIEQFINALFFQSMLSPPSVSSSRLNVRHAEHERQRVDMLTVRHNLYSLNKGSHSSDVESPRRNPVFLLLRQWGKVRERGIGGLAFAVPL